ncbi:MAG: polyphenol oxidase family protein [Desulfurivibrionaceae bacterium]|nr:polyphenol oxidase family protein [Desulfobulbales bacterium]MDT8335002.1 polyphenol oxidase family protein [Desulfurivibrionaceae bacterium]
MAESDRNRSAAATAGEIGYAADAPHPLQLDSFRARGLVHGFFNRHGGVSGSPFASLNVAFGVGDRVEAVRENRTRLKKSLGLGTLVSARQVHGDRVLVVAGEPEGDFEAPGYDALVSERPIGLMIQQADCQGVIFYDPRRLAIGAAHVGWRGSVAGTITATVKAMADSFGTDPANLRAAISPSLGPCCAEFVNYRRELPEWMHDFQVRPGYFDFWAISRRQLQEAGLAADNIEAAGICTRCNSDYFSFRRSRVTGRCATAIGLLRE